MSEVIAREVHRAEYQVTLDEHEYTLFQKLPELIRLGLEQQGEDEDGQLLGEYGSLIWKVMSATPETPDWWPEESKWHLSEDKITAEQIVELAKDDHIWINAFRAISPTPEFLQEVGQTVVRKLNQSYLRTEGFGEPDARGRKAGESPLVYLRVNKS